MKSKKKTCTKGYSCGISCISTTKACRKSFSDGVAVILESRKILRESAYEPKKVAPSDGFPEDLSKLEKVKRLGGSTGAMLMKDPATGKLYVMKKGNSPKHAYEEFLADRAYEALGIPVPKGKFYGNDTKLSEFIEGRTFNQLSSSELKAAQAQLSKNFAADALLSNWDVTGMGGDNVMLGNDGVVYRIDNGGSFRYRAQGAPKGSAFGDKVTELSTLRDSDINYYTAKTFSSLTDSDIEAQKRQLVAKKEALLKSIPDADLRAQMERRVDSFRSAPPLRSKEMDPYGIESVLAGGNYPDKKEEVAEFLVAAKMFKDKKTALETTEAIHDFTEYHYRDMRRSDKRAGNDSRLRAIYDNFLNNPKVPAYEGAVYRGMSFAKREDSPFLSLTTGDRVTLDALSSFSASESEARRFSQLGGSDEPYQVRLSVKSNKSGKSIQPLSSKKEELEVLVPKGASYKVASVKVTGDVTELELEEL